MHRPSTRTETTPLRITRHDLLNIPHNTPARLPVPTLHENNERISQGICGNTTLTTGPNQDTTSHPEQVHLLSPSMFVYAFPPDVRVGLSVLVGPEPNEALENPYTSIKHSIPGRCLIEVRHGLDVCGKNREASAAIISSM